MKVRELIMLFRQLNPELEVLTADGQGDWHRASLGEADWPYVGTIALDQDEYYDTSQARQPPRDSTKWG